MQVKTAGDLVHLSERGAVARFFDGGNFRVSASTDQKHWDILLEGAGRFAWRDVDLTPYIGGEVFVRFSNPTDKGEARVKQWRLLTTR